MKQIPSRLFLYFLANSTCSYSCEQTMIKEMEESNKHVRLIRTSSQKLLRVMDIQSEPGTEVQTEVAKVTHKQRDLSSSLRLRRSKVEKSLQLYGDFLEQIEKLEKWLPEGTERVQALEHVSGEPDAIRKELDKLQVCFRVSDDWTS